MAGKQRGYGATMVLVIVLVLAVLAVAAWRMGLFGRGSAADGQPTYEVGATDAGGGELIATDPSAPHIEGVELPKTPMTPVPPSEKASPSPAARAKVE